MQKLEKILQEIQEMKYPIEGIGCGLEDLGITDRYEAAEYGWNEAVDMVSDIVQNHISDTDNNEGIPEEERLPENENAARIIYGSRPEITKKLSVAVEKYINPSNDPRIYWAKEVTFDAYTTHAIRVDYMKFKPVNNTVSGIEKGDFYCYEIKSSVEDFRSKNGHNFIGDYNYYVMPREVYEAVQCEIPYKVGVLVPGGMHYRKDYYDLVSVKRAGRKDRDRSVTQMLLMMFRSAARDLRRSENE